VYQKNANKFIYDAESGFIKLFTNKEGLFEFLNSQETFTSNFENLALQRFLDICENYKKVTNWTIAIRTKGVQNGNILKKEISGFAEDIILTKRASKEKKYVDILLQKKLFKASGASSNIITSPKDLSLTLDNETIQKAEAEFKIKNPDKNYPNYIYVSSMKDTDGLLVVYLMDLKHIYSTEELKNIAITENINLDTPLVGFAVAIPPLKENFGGDYLVNAEIQRRLKLQENQIDDEAAEEEEDLIDELNGIINE
jgi:hypothetical protein